MRESIHEILQFCKILLFVPKLCFNGLDLFKQMSAEKHLKFKVKKEMDIIASYKTGSKSK